jgi:hypothetical protein
MFAYNESTIQVIFITPIGKEITEVLPNTNIISACIQVVKKYQTGIASIKIIEAKIIK